MVGGGFTNKSFLHRFILQNNFNSEYTTAKLPITHNRLDIGKWYVPDDRLIEFYELYALDFKYDIPVRHAISENAYKSGFRLFADIDWYSNEKIYNPRILKVTRIFQKVIKKFYINGNINTECFILCGGRSQTSSEDLIKSRAPQYTIELALLGVPKQTMNELHKVGIHLIFPHIIVNSDQVIQLHSSILHKLYEDPQIKTWALNWEETYDVKPYTCESPHLRLPGSYKVEKCKNCSKKTTLNMDPKCGYCNGAGILYGNKTYELMFIMKDYDEKDEEEFIKNIQEVTDDDKFPLNKLKNIYNCYDEGLIDDYNRKNNDKTMINIYENITLTINNNASKTRKSFRDLILMTRIRFPKDYPLSPGYLKPKGAPPPMISLKKKIKGFKILLNSKEAGHILSMIKIFVINELNTESKKEESTKSKNICEFFDNNVSKNNIKKRKAEIKKELPNMNFVYMYKHCYLESLTRSKKVYTAEINGDNCNYCPYIRGNHKSKKIFFKITEDKIYILCHCECSHHECKEKTIHFKSKASYQKINKTYSEYIFSQTVMDNQEKSKVEIKIFKSNEKEKILLETSIINALPIDKYSDQEVKISTIPIKEEEKQPKINKKYIPDNKSFMEIVKLPSKT